MTLKLTPLSRLDVPLGGQQIELQQVDFEGGGMSLLRTRIREKSRFTIFDIDPLTARAWGQALLDWAGEQPTETQPDLAHTVDVAFKLSASAPGLPPDHQALLLAALSAACPGWDAAPGSGIHMLSLSEGGWLSQRSRVVLRVVRTTLAQLTAPGEGEAATGLVGRPLVLGEVGLRLHDPQVRELLPWACLYAHLVVMTPSRDPPSDDEDPAAEELQFLQAATRALHALGVRGRLICGRRQQLPGPHGMLRGHSLMVDQLSPTHARRLLEQGLGLYRPLGCGLFVPHKSTAAVGVPPN